MSHSWYNLNIDISNALRKDWQFPKLDSNWTGLSKFSEIFDLEWLAYMESAGLYVGNTHPIFFKQKNIKETKAHIDLRPDNSIATFGLNWVIGGKDSKMCWYKEKTPNSGIRVKNSIGTEEHKSLSIMQWDIKDLIEIDSCAITSSMVLVRVDIPHAVFVEDQDRWAISVRLATAREKNLGLKSWEEIIDYLNNKNLLILR